jgi:hypothetical protein
MDKIKNIIIIFLITTVGIYNILLNNAKDKVEDITLEKEIIEKNLQNIIKVKNTEVKVVTRDGDKVTTRIEYLPPEGQIKISTDLDNKQHIELIDRGWTFRPNIGISYSDKMSFMLGARLFYWNRYGGGVAINSTGLSLYVDRRIDDFFNFLPNSSIGVFIGKQELGIKLSAFL